MRGYPLAAALGIAVVDHVVLAFDPAQLAHAGVEHFQRLRADPRTAAEPADAIDLAGRLGAAGAPCSEQRACDGADQRSACAHSITSSARSSSDLRNRDVEGPGGNEGNLCASDLAHFHYCTSCKELYALNDRFGRTETLRSTSALGRSAPASCWRPRAAVRRRAIVRVS